MLVKVPKHRNYDLHDVTDFVTLVGELQSADSSVRRRAVHSLRDTPSVVSIFCSQLETEDDTSVRAALLTSLIRMKSVDVAERLANLLRSETVALRNAVIEALEAMPDEALPILTSLLDDPDSDVRLFTVQIISNLGHPSVGSLLARVLRSESHVNVCLAAIDGLSEIEGHMLTPLLAAFGERFPDVPLAQYAAMSSVPRTRSFK